MDVNGREEGSIRETGVEAEGHRMDRLICPWCHTEDRKAVVRVGRELLPHVVRESKSRIQPVKVSEMRDERCLKGSDCMDLERGSPTGHRDGPERGLHRDRLGPPPVDVIEELRVASRLTNERARSPKPS